jgi:hypothetical protein
MTDEQYSEYMALWEQKQKAAADVAQRFYSDEMTSLVNEYVSKVPDALGIMKDDLYQVGQLAAKGLAQGILSQKSAVVSAARAVAAAARAALRSAEGIHSPAKKWAVLGDYMAQGIGVGFTRRMDRVSREITASIPSVDALTARERASAGMVNGIVSGLSAVMGSGSTQPIALQVNMDGKTIAQTIFDPLKDVIQTERCFPWIRSRSTARIKAAASPCPVYGTSRSVRTFWAIGQTSPPCGTGYRQTW